MSNKLVYNSETETWDSVELSPEELLEIQSNQPANQISYPRETIIEDRATGELYEGYIENGIWITQPLGESNG